MSYSEQDAHAEFNSKIDEVLNKRDIQGAHEIAEALAQEGDFAGASEFKALAKRWNTEDWAYDEASDNSLTN